MRKRDAATDVLGGVVAFCTLAFAPIERASAGCGDYLSDSHDSIRLSQDGGAPVAPATTRCNGPNCHRHDGPAPAPTPEFQAAPSSAKGAANVAALTYAGGFGAAQVFDDGARRLQGHATPLLRPPQNF